MKKKIIAALVGICTVVVMTGCGNKGISNDKITIKQYKGLEVEKVDPVEVTDTDVEDSINSTLQTKSTQNDITDRPAQEGDVVTIDYEGRKTALHSMEEQHRINSLSLVQDHLLTGLKMALSDTISERHLI